MTSQVQVPAVITGEVLEDMIRQATSIMETQTRRYFGEPETRVDIVVGNGTAKLWLLEPPITDEEIEVDESSEPGATPTTLIEETDFIRRTIENESWLARIGGVWAAGYEYTVRYLHGYELDAGPSDIERVIVGLVGLWLSRYGQDGTQSETIGDYSYTRATGTDLDLVPGSQAVIDAWRKPVMA